MIAEIRLPASMGEHMANVIIACVGCKTCVVTIHDLNDTAHSVDVTAETLYDAVAQAIVALRRREWVGEIGRGIVANVEELMTLCDVLDTGLARHACSRKKSILSFRQGVPLRDLSFRRGMRFP